MDNQSIAPTTSTDLSELLFFGIILYILVIIFLVCIRHCIVQRLFCACCDQLVHCSYLETNPLACSRCSLLQTNKSVFCCTKSNHSLYNCPVMEYHVDWFRPKCTLECCCCRMFVENKPPELL